jgi:hypothetical protein
MPIDPKSVVWDEPKASAPVDLSQVKWDDAEQAGQSAAKPPKGADPLSLGGVWRTMTGSLPSVQDVGNIEAGVLRGAGSVGSTLLAPLDMAKDAINGKGLSLESNRQRRASMDGGLQSLGAEPESGLYKTGKIGGEILGTAGVGGVLANGARAIGAAPSVIAGLGSGGLNVAGVTGKAGMALRGLTGAATGAATAGIVNPEDAGLGAAIGGGLPVLAKAGAAGMHKMGSALRGNLSPEVVTLAERAKELGVDIPVDRITNSKPLNALASSLDYVPFSGRAATNDRMASQLNRAVSRTLGQDTDNVAQAVKSARSDLGGEFDRVLKANTVRVDQQFTDDLAQHVQRAASELGADGERVIGKQVADIAAKIQNGQIDGQAAYNIKQTLDRIAKQNSPASTYAKDLKNSLMSALDRSLGADEAAAFAKTRQQYGNMKTIEKMVANGVEGDISIARLAGKKGIYNKDLQELADISAQFLKPRESAHGAAQRVSLGSLGIGVGAGVGSLPLALGAVAGGRATNSLLNSEAVKRVVMGGLLNRPTPLIIKRGLLGASKVAPVLTAQ